MRVGIVYDWVTTKYGGAERLLEAISKLFPGAPLYTAIFDPAQASWSRCFGRIYPSFLNKIPSRQRLYRLLAPLLPLGFERFNLDRFDLVISVTSGPAKAIITKPNTCHICYCLTPPRWLWGKRFLKYSRLYPFLAWLRFQDWLLAQRPDFYLAISKTVKARIKKHYQRRAIVVYPGIKFPPPHWVNQSSRQRFFLVVNRLVYYKKTELVVRVFNKLGWRLKIVGSGPEQGRLSALAKKNIQFLGNVPRATLWRLYSQAQALICPQEEDFGLTMVEAQAAGTPVIAYRQGGATEIVKEKETGLFFAPQTEEALLRALQEFRCQQFSPRRCQNQARHFTQRRFLLKFKKTILGLWQKYQKNLQCMKSSKG